VRYSHRGRGRHSRDVYHYAQYGPGSDG
jgi:hypothetical protein